MAKHTVSQEVMDLLNVLKDNYYETSERIFEGGRFVPLMAWIDDGDSFDDDNSRFFDVMRYAYNKEDNLFDVEHKYFGFVENNSLFRFNVFGNIVKLRHYSKSDVNMSFDDVQSLYDISNSGDKKIINSNGFIVKSNDDMPF